MTHEQRGVYVNSYLSNHTPDGQLIQVHLVPIVVGDLAAGNVSLASVSAAIGLTHRIRELGTVRCRKGLNGADGRLWHVACGPREQQARRVTISCLHGKPARQGNRKTHA